MRVVIGDRFRRWSSSSIAFRRWVTGILLVTHDSSVRPSPHSPRNRRQFLAGEASAAVGGFVHPHITLWRRLGQRYGVREDLSGIIDVFLPEAPGPGVV